MNEDLKKIIASSEYYSEIISEYVEQANKSTDKSEEHLNKLFVLSVEKILAKYDDETNKHVVNMMDLAKRFGMYLGLEKQEIETLVLVARFHDIGKINISSKILTKPARLDETEWKEIKLHPVYSYTILNQSNEFKRIADYVLHHHERFDGTGYPSKLMDKDIPIYSRILSVLDTYEVLIHGRVYKKAISKLDAINEIKRCSGTQFDPAVVKIFLDVCVKAGVIPKTETKIE